uniref:Uncharacterized protein n=1 Tax=Esox lucius TaxID=8010 RepID=A0A6Q2WQ89_ESOLU
MSLPAKIVKPPTVAVSGPGTGPSPSSQLRATLTSVSLPPPGAPGAPQPTAVPPPQIPRIQPSLDDRIFPQQPGVAAVYGGPRPPGPPYTAHDITKGHPNLAGTPPGHAHSPALSQVSVPTASPYRYPKGWEAGGGSPYTTGQNAGSAPLVYSPQTQQLNAQPQSRPFPPGPRPTHHQFFQRAQMQTARPTIPTNTPSLRPGSQNPTAAVYPPNQPTMMMMAPMPFPSPQAAQYYIPQYRHSTPYVPPQQFSVQPPGSGTFYPGPGPGEYPAQYAPGPQFYPGQQVYPPSPTPIIVPTPQQPPPAKREKKTIRIRDPNQGGKDITEEIMAGGTGSRNPTPPVGRPSSTPTPPQVRTYWRKTLSLLCLIRWCVSSFLLDDKPKLEPVVQKSSSPGLKQAEPFMDRREAIGPVTAPYAVVELCPVTSLTEQPLAPITKTQTPNTVEPLPEVPLHLSALPSPAPTLKALNGHADTGAELDAQAQEPSPVAPPPSQPKASVMTSEEDRGDSLPSEVRADVPSTVAEVIAPAAVVPIALSSSPSAFPAPPPGLPPLVKAVAEHSKPSDTKDIPLKAGTEALISPDSNSSPPPPAAVPPALEAEEKPPTPEENGEADLEPMRNGAGHTSETESSDSGATPGDKEGSTGVPPDLFQEDPTDTNGKRQYNREFLLAFQFMAACTQKPDGLPQISDVVLDKINQNKLPTRTVESRVISRGPDFTPAFADFGRQMSGGRGGAPVRNTRRLLPRKIILNVSANDEVQLKKAENAWKPGMKRAGPSDDPQVVTTQELFRKVRSILNKLTPQMFNQLMKQVTDLTIDTEERLKGVIDLVFEKAIDEPGFSVAYGNMCRCLATLKVPMTDKPSTTVNFRKLLLNRCQKEFERDKVDDVVFERKQKELDSAQSSDQERLRFELEEAKDKARRRSIGNIKFIGELFKLKMLTEAIMHDCVVKLLKNHDEESLECLCRLLTTIGKDLDFEKAKPRMDQYFNQMEKIVKERKTSSRIRFMLQDVIDLRLHNWVSRRADQGPKTIEQIHKEAKIEEQEEQRKVHQQLLSKDTKRRPEQQREQRVQQREETWNTVPMTKNSRTIDPTKIPKISKPQMDEKIQLGPRASLNWMKGSSGGAKASDSEFSRSGGGGASLNRYSALQSTQSHQNTAQNTEYDSRRTIASRSSVGRERSEKPLSSTLSRPGSFIRRGSSKDLLESPALSPEEPRRELESPMRPAFSEDKTEPELSRAREPVKAEPVVSQSPDKPPISEEDMEKKSKAIIDEFLHINDYKEAVQCVDELDLPSQLYVFVRVGVDSTLERSQITRDHMGQLLFQLVQQDILSKPQFFKGFSDTLELADDMAIDIPHIWLYLAELLSPVLREGGFSMRELFSELSKPLFPVGRAGILFSEILHILCKQMSHRKVGTLWRESGLSWSDFLPEGEDVQDFISQQKVQFTLAESTSSEAALSTTVLSPEALSRQLERLLLEDMATDEQIFDWVEANLDESQMSSSPFLRALMTAVCKAAVKDESTSCRVDVSIIQRRLPVLLKYLNSDTERQLQALYALQTLIVSLDQPPNLLRMFFDCLYDEDVISEDAFYKWETSKDPAEQLGKGVALKSVTAFFTWLREAEEESEDN